jgi:SAM-dependent methyltransferase
VLLAARLRVASNKDSMNKTYQDLFDVRGSSYDGAMQRYPQAREQEFAQVVSAVPLQPGMVVADVPAGGGYLRAYLPAGCQWLGHEPCAGFTQHGAASGQGKPWLPLPWCDAAVDVVISLAGVHHVDDKRPLWAELWRVVKPGGHLVLSDVAAGTPVARFLDGYVGAHNSTGHEGRYLDEQTLRELADAGWLLQRHGMQRFHWVFAQRAAMAAFCHGLFDLRGTTEAHTQAAIEAQLGVTAWPDGRVGMHWSLMTVVAVRP